MTIKSDVRSGLDIHEFKLNYIFYLILLFQLMSCNSKKIELYISLDRNKVNFNQSWRFHKGEVDDGQNVDFDDSQWRDVSLPHDWSIEAPFSSEWASGTGFLPGGIGWYRKSFMVPAEEKGRKIFINFGGVYNNSTVWINEHKLGTRPNGYVSFQYDMTNYIKYGEENTIAVRVDHSEFADSRWYTGSGIYRNVELVTTYPLRVDNWGVFVTTPKVTKSIAEVSVKVKVVNDLSDNTEFVLGNYLMLGQDTIALTEENKVIDSSDDDTYTQTFKVEKPELWSPENPTLYRLVTALKKDGKVLDKTSTNVGIRDVKFVSNKGMYLNGENIKLKGICMHQDGGCLGAAVPKMVMRYRLEMLKELGCNAIRLTHNPFSNEFLDLCDEMGFLVVAEAFDEWELPKRKWVDGWNKGNPSHEGYAYYFKKWHEQDLTDMILRDRNHPSVIMWSIGNEIDYPTDPYSHPILNSDENPITWARYNPRLPDGARLGKIAWKLATIIKKNDTTRPVTAGLALSLMASEVGYANVLDVVGYNYQQAVYESDHNKFPERIMYASESKKTYEAWKFVKDHDYFFGQFLWKGFDFIGEAHEFPYHNIPTGLIDLIGNRRCEYYYRKSIWSDKPLIHIGTAATEKLLNHANWGLSNYCAHWQYNEGEKVSVAVFSNCNEIELFLNGKLIGRKKMSEADENMAIWDIPFTKGELVAIGKTKAGEEVVFNLTTPTIPVKLSISVNKTLMRANMEDVVQAYVNITDANNNLITSADNTIHCDIKGAVKLLAMGDANTQNTESCADNEQNSYNGRIVAYLQAQDIAGESVITFSSKGLVSDTLFIKILPDQIENKQIH